MCLGVHPPWSEADDMGDGNLNWSSGGGMHMYMEAF